MIDAGLYIVTLNNKRRISVNAGDPRRADRCIKVNYKNCKFGRAESFSKRYRNYVKHFGQKYISLFPLAEVTDTAAAEQVILKALSCWRIKGRCGRKNEWLEGISVLDVRRLAFNTLRSNGISYRRLPHRKYRA